MAANLALSKADVSAPDATYEQASVTVRANVATVRERRTSTLLTEKAGVTRVERTGTNVYTLTFEDGEQWRVRRLGGCGCGGG